ncbi:MAG TPA: VCBS repeat-containing protein, partial [Kofleriaceae bacterium]|nr:VCBS repeat-containing protein [Kofleriaceae bacterium]
MHRATVGRAGAGAALACALACAGPPGEALEGPPCGARGPAVGWFREVAPATSGLAFLHRPVDFRSGPLAVADLDGDGRLDVVAGSRAGGAAAFRNLGGLRFARWDGAARLEAAGPVHALAPADLDRDGDL